MINKISYFIDTQFLKIILIAAVVLSISSFIYCYQNGLITAYGDSRAHLNIARRVVDSLTPGFAQLGGAWLPLLHVLMIPTVWIDPLWHSGISGSFVNMPAYVLAVYFLCKLVYEATKSKLNTLIAFVIFAFNVNVLYFQATPMGEVLFISTLIIAIYYLYKWANTQNVLSLVASAVFFMLSSLNRYEGWFFAVGAVGVVAIISLSRQGWRKAEGTIIIFSVVACLGIALWLLWQLLIFGDPLDFLHSEFAAGVNTARDIEAGIVPTHKDIKVSILTQFYASTHSNGLIITILGLAAVAFSYIKVKLNIFHAKNLIFLVALIPFVFGIYVMYKGNVPTYVPEIRIDREMPDFFNVRYTLFALPAFALFISTLTRQRMIQLILLEVAIINSLSLLPLYGRKVTALQDWGNLSTREHIEPQVWFRKNYDKGLILVSVASSDAFIFKTRIDMDKFISEGSGKYWDISLERPYRYARWVIIQESDRDMLGRYLNNNSLRRHFDLQAKTGGYKFYKKKPNDPYQ